MKTTFFFSILLFFPFFVSAQNVLACAGNNQQSGAISQSYTVGETIVSDFIQSGKETSQGFQQPEIPTLLVRMFLQGFYIGGGMMEAIADPINAPLLTDTISLSLMNNDLNSTQAFQRNVLLFTNGYSSTTLPASLFGRSFFLKINHRNSIETWSALPIQLKTVNRFDFTAP